MFDFKIRNIFKEISNYIYLIFKVKKLSKTRDWAKNRLEYGWFFQIGTIINMNKEDFGESEDVLMTRCMARAESVFQYITNNNLGDVVTPKIRRFGENYAFTLTFWPIFNYLSVWYVVSRIFMIYIVYYVLNLINDKFDIVNLIISFFK